MQEPNATIKNGMHSFIYRKNIITPLVTVIFLLWFTVIAYAKKPLVLVTPTNTVDTVISEVIVREAYRRLGIEAIIKKYPAERAIRLANYGEIDGEVQRIDGLARRYKNLIQVRPPINFLEATVFSKSTAFQVQGWDSLRPYRIGLIRGIKFAERHTAEMNAHPVSSYPALFRMLDRGRFDIVLSPGVNGLYHIKKLGIRGIEQLRPSVMRFDLFHYLHRKNEDLAPLISTVFNEMKKSGELEALRQHVLSVLMSYAEKNLPICDEDYKCFER